MNQNLKQSNAIAYLRQLCCLGLDKGIVIPEFLRAVQTVIPSGSNTFTGVDERFTPSYHLLEFVPTEFDEVTPLVVSSFYTPERLSRGANWFRQHQVCTDMTVLDESFYESDMYNLVFRPFDQHHALNSPVMQLGKPVGMVALYRPCQQKPFNSNEQALFVRLLPYVTHALHTVDGKDIQYSENGSLGMMIMDTHGTILYLTNEAKNLLALVCHPVLAANACVKKNELLAKLARLCRDLDTIFRGKDAAPPAWSHTNDRGRFTFRAYWLNKQNNEPGGLVGMTIEHQEPLVLKILRAMQNLPLSSRQKEVALMLAQGFSSEKIGERLHIKLTTVKDHIDKIFTKLDIYHREELLPKLLSMDSSKPVIRIW